MDKKKLKQIFADDPEMLRLLESRDQTELLQALAKKVGDSESKIKMTKIEYLKGEQGDPFKYEDLTPEQKLELKGEKGDKPTRGVDYFTSKDVEAIANYIKIGLKEEVTPRRGVDYFDGNDADEDKIIEVLTERMPKFLPSADEIASRVKPAQPLAVDIDSVVKRVLSELPEPKFPTIDEIVKEIKSKRLIELRDIKGARLDSPKGTMNMNDQRWHGGGFTSLNGLLVAGTGISITGLGTIASPYIISATSTGGITSINADTTAAQILAIGTAGTDFALVDNGVGTHTFNLPTASHTNRGALSSADWDTFNNKQNTITPAALTRVNDTNVTLALGGTPATALLQAVSLTLGWSGQLSLARGGTGANLTAPGANVLLGYDNTDASVAFFTIGSGLSYDHSTHTLSAGGGGGGTVTSVASADGSITVTNPTTTPDLAVVKAPKLTTARTIGGVSFDGTANITVASATGGFAVSGGNLTMATNKITGVGDPTSAQDAATKNYVDNAIAAVNPAVAVQAASAAKLPNSPTYNNGASGIGAFITTATLNTALVVDGYTPALLDRILVKNEGDSGGLGAAKNGVYYVSQLAAVGLAWILTRAVDYDQPSDINNTGAIPVMNNGTNALTSWLLTTQVATVGTDPLTYIQFSYNPTSVVPPNLGGTGIANNAASTITISGSFALTITLSAGTSVTFPISGTLANLAGAQAFTNKDLTGAGNTFPTFNQNTTGSAAKLTTARTIGGVSFDGTANITVASATGGFTVSGGDLALGANNITMTGSLAATGARVTKGWFTDLESSNMPTVGGTAILTSLTAPQFTTIELGNASDTTISRVSAGVIAVEGSTVALASNKLSFFSATTSAELAGVISDETGTGLLVFGTAPTFASTINVVTGIKINGAATSGTILRADGTNFIQSAFTMALPGTSGNVLTSDGTNWLSSAPAAAGISVIKSGIGSHANGAGNITITHGLGKTPVYFRIYYMQQETGNGAQHQIGMGGYDGTTNNNINGSTVTNAAGESTTASWLINPQQAFSTSTQIKVTAWSSTTVTLTVTTDDGSTFTYFWEAFG